MLFSRNKPRWLYAAMPVIYLTVGVVVSASLSNMAGRLSGGLLVLASIAIFILRSPRARAARAAREAPASRSSTVFAPTGRLAATTEFVRAIVPPDLGHVDIDRQHRGLASRAATLRVAFAHNDEQAELELLIHELIDTFAQHLDAEIDAMARLGVEREQEDVQADRARLASAGHDVELYRSGGMMLGTLIERIAGPLVAGHLRCRHPALPSMESVLQQLRQAKASS